MNEISDTKTGLFVVQSLYNSKIKTQNLELKNLTKNPNNLI